MKNTRTIRAAVAAGAVGTALLTSTLLGGVADAGYDPCQPKFVTEAGGSIIDPCYTPITRDSLPERPTTTTEATTTTTEAERPTTTEGERPTTTMGTTSTTMGTTTTAPTVGGATGARPVAAQASYTG